MKLSSEDVTFYLEGNLHDLQDIGRVFMQQTNFGNGEILFEFLHREVHTLRKINLQPDTMYTTKTLMKAKKQMCTNLVVCVGVVGDS